MNSSPFPLRPEAAPVRVGSLTQSQEVQHALSTWADSLAYPGTPSCGHSRLPNSKSFLDRLNQDLEPLRGDDDPGLPLAVQYLNRLSDLLFVMARTLNRAEGRPDILWQRHRHG